MYYAEKTYEPIIEKTVFDKVCKNLERSRQKVKSSKEANAVYPFTSKIKCQNYGKNYKRKKYRGIPYWNCTTYLEEGKEHCFAKRIPEEILMSKTCEVLGINDFNETLFNEKVKQIIVLENGLLTFVFHGGDEATLKWENKPRSESWSEEKKQAARERAINFLKEGK